MIHLSSSAKDINRFHLINSSTSSSERYRDRTQHKKERHAATPQSIALCVYDYWWTRKGMSKPIPHSRSISASWTATCQRPTQWTYQTWMTSFQLTESMSTGMISFGWRDRQENEIQHFSYLVPRCTPFHFFPSAPFQIQNKWKSLSILSHLHNMRERNRREKINHRESEWLIMTRSPSTKPSSKQHKPTQSHSHSHSHRTSTTSKSNSPFTMSRRKTKWSTPSSPPRSIFIISTLTFNSHSDYTILSRYTNTKNDNDNDNGIWDSFWWFRNPIQDDRG